jgi:oligopeptide transport system substrate-binding protein
MRSICIFFGLGLSLASCGQREQTEPVTASLIGPALKLANPSAMPPDAGAAFMLTATAQGLVAFDSAGRIEPALAERWIFTDDGLSLIFRIRRAEWADGTPVTAAQVAQQVRAAMAPNSRNRLKPLMSSIDQVIAMTGEVIEIRLKRSDPDLLQLFAQPDLAMFNVKVTQGTGPYRVHSMRDGVTRLRPVLPEDAEPPEDDRADIRLRAENASIALARFAARDANLVTGGGFNELPLARAAQPPAAQFQVDPTYGLFGLAPMAGSPALARAETRRALAMAIDRQALIARFGTPGMRTSVTLLPTRLDSSAAPAALEWVQQDMNTRRARARAYLSEAGPLPTLRVAMPDGPGARLLFATIAADWKTVGVSARMVRMRDAADLRLVDEVAPQSAALWYLMRVSCARGLQCSTKGELALRGAINAETAESESNAIAEADAAFASDQVFIPLLQPLRWSLVAPQLTGWRASAFATHPLRHLRDRN